MTATTKIFGDKSVWIFETYTTLKFANERIS